MMIFTRCLLLGAFLVPAALLGQTRPAPAARSISASEIDAHVRFLSSDLLEGRAPATRGGRLAAEYIAAQLQIAGVQPGNGGSYFQRVPIDIVGADRQAIRARATGRASATLRYPEDVVMWAGSAAPSSAARAEMVFVGYGSAAPEYRWDDFKDVDVRGKILLVLVNDPPALPGEPNLFGGRAMTYYGRWTYKFEEAERRGAAGMLIVHTTEQAGYPWHTVVGSRAKEQRMLPRPSDGPAPIAVRGWITDSAASSLLREAGLDLTELRRRAATREFRPVATGIELDISFTNAVQRLDAANVVGVVRGTGGRLRNEYVSFTAHFDHLGIGPPVIGDSIYNGAYDNASGTAVMLAVARAAVERPKARRSMLFVFVDAEESGLLGSQYFAEHPTVPIEQIIANLNVDLATPFGRFRDVSIRGDNKSSLGPSLAALVRPIRLTPEPHPERGYFYRSDHFSFAKVGVPAISIAAGEDYVGRPAGWGAAAAQDYTDHRYHQPSDEYDPRWDWAGAAQLGEIVYRFGKSIADSPRVPTWNREAEFYSLRPTAR